MSDWLYQPTDIQDELFLSDIPLELVESAIREQFEDPFENRKRDYVQTYITRYEYTEENMDFTDEFDLDYYNDQFLSFMLKLFKDKLQLGFSDFDSLSTEEQFEKLHLTYRFFITNMKKNFVNVVINFINDETYRKGMLDILMVKAEQREDPNVTLATYQLEGVSEEDSFLISEFSEVYRFIIRELTEEGHLDIMDFLELCNGDEVELELEFMKEAFRNGEITGNFAFSYFGMISSELRSVLESTVRNKILSKYPMRKPQVELTEKQKNALRQRSEKTEESEE